MSTHVEAAESVFIIILQRFLFWTQKFFFLRLSLSLYHAVPYHCLFNVDFRFSRKATSQSRSLVASLIPLRRSRSQPPRRLLATLSPPTPSLAPRHTLATRRCRQTFAPRHHRPFDPAVRRRLQTQHRR